MFMGNLVHPPVALMRRQHVNRAGGLDVAMTWTCEDYEFFWRVANAQVRFLEEGGKVTGAVLTQDGRTVEMEKVG